jgi:hypothetical protein
MYSVSGLLDNDHAHGSSILQWLDLGTWWYYAKLCYQTVCTPRDVPMRVWWGFAFCTVWTVTLVLVLRIYYLLSMFSFDLDQ